MQLTKTSLTKLWLATAIPLVSFSALADNFYVESTFIQNGQTMGPPAFNIFNNSDRTFNVDHDTAINYSIIDNKDGSVNVEAVVIKTNKRGDSYQLQPIFTISANGESNGMLLGKSKAIPFLDWQLSAIKSYTVTFHQLSSDKQNCLNYTNESETLCFDSSPVMDTDAFLYIRTKAEDSSVLEIKLTENGASALRTFTHENINQWMGVMIDGQLVNASVIRSEMGGDILMPLPKRASEE
jgi:preprotein translocase subunit SecD